MSGMRQTVRDNEQGFAAIIVTMVLLIVLSLITVGFAAQMRKEQQSALDAQLSAQAYYAAESGVNDYAQSIKKYLANNTPPTEVTALAAYFNSINSPGCSAPAGSTVYGGLPSNTLSSGVKYTCVIVNAVPKSLQYGSIGTTSQVIPITAIGSDGKAVALDKLVLSWQPTSDPANPSTSACPLPSGIDSFPASTGWSCPLSILRTDLVPTAGSSYTLQTLQADTMTAFLVPTKAGTGSGGTVGYNGSGKNQYGSTANQGVVAAAKCSEGTPRPSCTMTITGLAASSYYLRISTVYGTAALNVQGYTLGDSQPVELSGAQILIDSTGLAQDVLRRIQVRIPVDAAANGDAFNAAIQSAESLCKQFQTAPPNVYNAGSCSP